MMRAEGFAESLGEGCYIAGRRLKALAAEVASSVVGSADPLLRELRDRAGGNSVHLAFETGREEFLSCAPLLQATATRLAGPG